MPRAWSPAKKMTMKLPVRNIPHSEENQVETLSSPELLACTPRVPKKGASA